MQGILPSHYKLLNDCLKNALIENKDNNNTLINENSILEHKIKLDELYNKYQLSILNMVDLIDQFESHKLAIRRLVVLQKKKKKQSLKNLKNKNLKKEITELALP